MPTASAARPPMPTIDLVEDQCALAASLRCAPLRRPPASAPRLNARLQRQHHSRQLATRRDLLDRTKRLSGIGGDQVLRLVESRGAPVPFFIRAADLDLEVRLHRQFIDLALDHLLQLARGFMAMAGKTARCFQIFRAGIRQFELQRAQDLILVLHLVELAFDLLAERDNVIESRSVFPLQAIEQQPDGLRLRRDAPARPRFLRRNREMFDRCLPD